MDMYCCQTQLVKVSVIFFEITLLSYAHSAHYAHLILTVAEQAASFFQQNVEQY